MKLGIHPSTVFRKQFSNTAFWLSLLTFALLMSISALMFEAHIQQSLEQLNQTASSQTLHNIGLIIMIELLLVLDVLLPVPSAMVALLTASSLGIAGGSLVIFIGLCGGSLFGYALGAGYLRLASGWLCDQDKQEAGRLANHLGTWALICLRGVPLLAEISVLAAGMRRYPLRQFVWVTTLANAGLALAYGYIGSFLAGQQALLLVILASMFLPALLLILRTLLQGRQSGRQEHTHS